MRILILIAALFPFTVVAQDSTQITDSIVSGHILPGFHALSQSADVLQGSAVTNCVTDTQTLRESYNTAFDAWIAVSHLRFGPTEAQDRAFALAFWPDSRGATPKALMGLIANTDAIAYNANAYKEVSIAARGFYALEFLLYDDAILAAGTPTYRCQLVQTITTDIAQMTAEIAHEWQTDYATQLMNPTPDGPYRSPEEAVQVLFKSLSTGLQFTSETRLGRPLGTFEHPRPTRAEAWRSGRSLHHVQGSLVALRDLAVLLAQTDASVLSRLETAFDRSLSKAANLDDPIFAGVADPKTRFRVEALKTSIDTIRTIVRDELGPTLGVTAGFNALDGD